MSENTFTSVVRRLVNIARGPSFSSYSSRYQQKKPAGASKPGSKTKKPKKVAAVGGVKTKKPKKGKKKTATSASESEGKKTKKPIKVKKKNAASASESEGKKTKKTKKGKKKTIASGSEDETKKLKKGKKKNKKKSNLFKSEGETTGSENNKNMEGPSESEGETKESENSAMNETSESAGEASKSENDEKVDMISENVDKAKRPKKGKKKSGASESEGKATKKPKKGKKKDKKKGNLLENGGETEESENYKNMEGLSESEGETKESENSAMNETSESAGEASKSENDENVDGVSESVGKTKRPKKGKKKGGVSESEGEETKKGKKKDKKKGKLLKSEGETKESESNKNMEGPSESEGETNEASESAGEPSKSENDENVDGASETVGKTKVSKKGKKKKNALKSDSGKKKSKKGKEINRSSESDGAAKKSKKGKKKSGGKAKKLKPDQKNETDTSYDVGTNDTDYLLSDQQDTGDNVYPLEPLMDAVSSVGNRDQMVDSRSKAKRGRLSRPSNMVHIDEAHVEPILHQHNEEPIEHLVHVSRAMADMFQQSLDTMHHLVYDIDSTAQALRALVAAQQNRMEAKGGEKEFTNLPPGAYYNKVGFSGGNSGGPRSREAMHTIGRQLVEVRVVFVQIAEIDTVNQQFEAEVYIQARWREHKFSGLSEAKLATIEFYECSDPRLKILNLVGDFDMEKTSMVLRYDPDTICPALVYTWHVRGVFRERMELQHFPFDVQELSVVVSSELPIEDVELVGDFVQASSVSKGALQTSQDWSNYRHVEITRDVSTREMDGASQHSVLVVAARVKRKLGFYFWNVIIIVLLIQGMTICLMAVDPTGTTRLALSVTLFLTTVAFKLVVKNTLPSISYLTYLDLYVVFVMAHLFLVASANALMCHLARFREKPKVLKYDEIAQSCLIALLVVFHLMFMIYIQLTAASRRRQMSKLDVQYKIAKLLRSGPYEQTPGGVGTTV